MFGCLRVCPCVFVRVHAHICEYACMSVCMHVHICECVCMSVCMHMLFCVCVCCVSVSVYPREAFPRFNIPTTGLWLSPPKN